MVINEIVADFDNNFCDDSIGRDSTIIFMISCIINMWLIYYFWRTCKAHNPAGLLWKWLVIFIQSFPSWLYWKEFYNVSTYVYIIVIYLIFKKILCYACSMFTITIVAIGYVVQYVKTQYMLHTQYVKSYYRLQHYILCHNELQHYRLWRNILRRSASLVGCHWGALLLG